MPPAPNMLWVSDFTYVATWTRLRRHEAFVIDTYARRIVGWRVSQTWHASFVLDAPGTGSLEIGGPCGEAGSCTTAIEEAAKAQFKRSSQHDLCRLIGETGQAPLQVSSNQASFRGRGVEGGDTRLQSRWQPCMLRSVPL